MLVVRIASRLVPSDAEIAANNSFLGQRKLSDGLAESLRSPHRSGRANRRTSSDSRTIYAQKQINKFRDSGLRRSRQNRFRCRYKDRYCSRVRKAGLSFASGALRPLSSSAFSKCFQIGWPAVINGTVVPWPFPGEQSLAASRRKWSGRRFLLHLNRQTIFEFDFMQSKIPPRGMLPFPAVRHKKGFSVAVSSVKNSMSSL